MRRIRKNTFLIHTIAFVLMVISPALLYFAARSGNMAGIWALLGLFVFGNLLVIAPK